MKDVYGEPITMHFKLKNYPIHLHGGFYTRNSLPNETSTGVSVNNKDTFMVAVAVLYLCIVLLVLNMFRIIVDQ